MPASHLTTVLSLEDFQRLWSAENERIFADRDLPDNPFEDASWRVVCICGPVAYVNEPHGHPADLSDPHQRIFAALMMRDRAMDAFGVQIFGRSCRWGVNVSADEELSAVGGDAAFMEQFIDEAGGDQALRDAFAHCADYLLNFPRGAEFIRRLRGLAGWRGPF